MKLLHVIAVFAAATAAPGDQPRPSVAPKNMQNLTPALAEYILWLMGR